MNKNLDSNNLRISDLRLRRRHRADRRYRLYGQLAIVFALLFLLMFFFSIITRALPAFWYQRVNLSIELSSRVLGGGAGDFLPREIPERQARKLLDEALALELGLSDERATLRARRALLTPLAALELKKLLEERSQHQGSQDQVVEQGVKQEVNQGIRIGDKLLLPFALSSASDNYISSLQANGLAAQEASTSSLSEPQRRSLSILQQRGLIEKHFNFAFFVRSDSRTASSAGIWGALVGSFWALLIAFLLAFPLGLGTAIHLQEFAPRNRFTYIIEVAIYNLAAVPSIVFGLLGLSIFLNWWHLPRSAPLVGGMVLALLPYQLVGGMVLALMTLPTIVVASRNALASVSEGIRSAGLALGASREQVVFHHVLPRAMPGILTGTIIGMAQALGETAPLLMIGMVAFVAQAPLTPLEPATALPVQIFLWADHPDPAFSSRSAAAILVMLVFLIVMNAAAVILRRSFERRG